MTSGYIQSKLTDNTQHNQIPHSLCGAISHQYSFDSIFYYQMGLLAVPELPISCANLYTEDLSDNTI